VNASLLDRIDQLCAADADADDVLRGVVRLVADEQGVAFVEIRFVEADRLVEGPSAGAPDEARRRATTIEYRGAPVGELVVDGEFEDATARRVADAISTFVLLGWDTGGATWEP
jgi:hypothetical protein